MTAAGLFAAAAALVLGQCTLPAPLNPSVGPKSNAGFAHRHGKLRLGGPKGLQLVDEAGAAVQLTGMSSHGLQWFPECVTEDAIAALAGDWGVNVVRAAMYVGEGGYATKPSVKQVVLDMVAAAKKVGIYVLIDWHVLNPGNPNDAVYSGADAFWTEMATRFANESHVLYEIANEPNGVSWDETLAYHNRIISLIRKIDAETVIIAGTTTWSQDLQLAAAKPVAQPHNVMYTFHFYAGTHMGLLPRLVKYAHQIPVFVTEWGETTAGVGQQLFLDNSLTFAETLRNESLLGVKVSWAQWAFADKNEGTSALPPGGCAAKAWGKVSCDGLFTRTFIRTFAEN